MTIVYYHRLQFPSESGQTIQVLRDYHALARRGDIIHIVYRDLGAHDEAMAGECLRDYGLEPLPNFRLHGLKKGGSSKAHLRSLVERIICDAVGGTVFLVTRTLDHASAAMALRKVSQGVKVILELHETAIPHMVYREQGRTLRSWLSRLRERNVFSGVDGIISTVGSQVGLLDRLYPTHAPVEVLPNGVPDAWLAPHGLIHKGDRSLFRLGYAGQFNAWKNVDILIEALRHLPQYAVLNIAGGKAGEEAGTRARLLSFAATVGVKGRVNYVGLLPPGQVGAFLAEQDVLLLPLGNNAQSRLFTSPMKLFEYAAVGVPMVVTRQPTTESLIVDGEHAAMCEPESAVSMATAVRKLMDDPGLAASMAERARSWVAQYAYDRRAERLEVFLESLEAAT